mmetsp:Transcript_18415/g.36812  ORF Transcript_18415/g.36812 Transcript_18415/m.36812 type:complete len:509 (+) Transcript_18415:90-1616(+)
MAFMSSSYPLKQPWVDEEDNVDLEFDSHSTLGVVGFASEQDLSHFSYQHLLPVSEKSSLGCSPPECDEESGEVGKRVFRRHRPRSFKLYTHICFVSALLMVAYYGLQSLLVSEAVSRSDAGVMAPTLGSLFRERGSRNLLVVPYCALANRLTVMIESLSISAESGRTSILNWLSTEEEQAQFGDLFDIQKTPFSSIYENADLPDSINPSTFSEAVIRSRRPLILSERDIPWLTSTVKNQPKSFLERQTEFFRKRMWNRKHHEDEEGRRTRQKKSSSGLIYAGCHNKSPDSLGFLKEIWPEDISSAISASQRHVSQAMYLFSSVKSSILSEVLRFEAVLNTYARRHDIPLIVGVHISDSNSPLRRDSESGWKETERELDALKDRALFYVASNDNDVISYFCGKYDHVVAFSTSERTGGSGPRGATDDSVLAKNHQIASLIELLNLGSTDFVIGSQTSSFSMLSRWLASQNIVTNVLKQQTKLGRIKRPHVSIHTQDYSQCMYEAEKAYP